MKQRIKQFVFRHFFSDEIQSSVDYMFLGIRLPDDIHYLLKSNYHAFRHLFNGFEDYKHWLNSNYGDKLPIKVVEYLQQVNKMEEPC